MILSFLMFLWFFILLSFLMFSSLSLLIWVFLLISFSLITHICYCFGLRSLEEFKYSIGLLSSVVQTIYSVGSWKNCKKSEVEVASFFLNKKYSTLWTSKWGKLKASNIFCFMQRFLGHTEKKNKFLLRNQPLRTKKEILTTKMKRTIFWILE